MCCSVVLLHGVLLHAAIGLSVCSGWLIIASCFTGLLLELAVSSTY